MEEWKRAWIHGPAVDPEELLPQVWKEKRSEAYGMWNDSAPLPLVTVVRFNKAGIEAAVTWAIYMRLEPDPEAWSMWVHNRGAFHRDGFLDLIRKRVAVVHPSHNPRGPELAALAHSLVLTAIVPQAEASYPLTPGQVPQRVRDFIGVDTNLKI